MEEKNNKIHTSSNKDEKCYKIFNLLPSMYHTIEKKSRWSLDFRKQSLPCEAKSMDFIVFKGRKEEKVVSLFFIGKSYCHEWRPKVIIAIKYCTSQFAVHAYSLEYSHLSICRIPSLHHSKCLLLMQSSERKYRMWISNVIRTINSS